MQVTRGISCLNIYLIVSKNIEIQRSEENTEKHVAALFPWNLWTIANKNHQSWNVLQANLHIVFNLPTSTVQRQTVSFRFT